MAADAGVVADFGQSVEESRSLCYLFMFSLFRHPQDRLCVYRWKIGWWSRPLSRCSPLSQFVVRGFPYKEQDVNEIVSSTSSSTTSTSHGRRHSVELSRSFCVLFISFNMAEFNIINYQVEHNRLIVGFEKNIKNHSFRLLALKKTAKIVRFDCWLWKKQQKLFVSIVGFEKNMENRLFPFLQPLPRSSLNT